MTKPAERDRRFLPNALATVATKARDASGGIATGSDPAHPLICGYAAVFYNPNDAGTEFELYPGFVERIDPHAFDRAVRDDDVRGLFNHDPSQILGRNKSGTMTLRVDSKGLYYEIDPPATTDAKRVTVALERQDVTGSSFMFDIEVDEYVRDGDRVIRTIKQAILYDVGPVTFPAYTAATSTLSQRSLDGFKAVAAKVADPIKQGRDFNLAKRQLQLLNIT
ncbi:MAG: HK97 family phage prohead protease [Planctomycetota bacterium]